MTVGMVMTVGRTAFLIRLNVGNRVVTVQNIKILPESPPKPYNYFDMIKGTSTGGSVNSIVNVAEFRADKQRSLIAIMLSRLQMTVDEGVEF